MVSDRLGQQCFSERPLASGTYVAVFVDWELVTLVYRRGKGSAICLEQVGVHCIRRCIRVFSSVPALT